MRNIWLDCDPGHDDATAILLAIHCPNVRLLGISTVHGNASTENTIKNAARCLYAFAAPQDVRVHPGAAKPLIRHTRHDPEIHGIDGLGGVEGLPSTDCDGVRARLPLPGQTTRAIEGIADAIRETWKQDAGEKVVIISSGPMTNIALFVSVYPDLLDGIEEFVFMGGGIGMGNRGASAEFNILCDPEAAQIVLNVLIKKTMIPLNVTHTAIMNRSRRAQLLCPDSPSIDGDDPSNASTKLRRMLWTLVHYFANRYKLTFGFTEGPPLHDALTIAYVSQPELFTCKRYRIDVELAGAHSAGETVADVWDYRHCDDSWGTGGKNCLVATSVDAPGFFKILLDCVSRCDAVTPLNA